MSNGKQQTNNIGGQAVIEGVMMRGKKIYAMAVRNPEGEIVVEKKPVGGLGKKGLFRYPIFRGMAWRLWIPLLPVRNTDAFCGNCRRGLGGGRAFPF